MPDRDPPSTWTAWHRPSARASWRPVCQAATETAAWTRLLRVEGGDKCVLPAGRDPNRRGEPCPS